MSAVSVRDEYAPKFGRQALTLWSGAFASTFEGWAIELPGHDGFMVELDYFRGKVRVACESPRTDENFARVDDAIASAVDEHLAHYGRATAGNNRRVHLIRRATADYFVTMCGAHTPRRPQTTQDPLPKCARCFGGAA